MERAAEVKSLFLERGKGRNLYHLEILNLLQIKHCEIVNKTSKLIVEIPMIDKWRNDGGAIHGGAVATIIDLITSLLVFILKNTPSVSIELSVSYISALREAKSMEVEAICYKNGRTLSFTSAEIKANGILIATGRHIMFTAAKPTEKL